VNPENASCFTKALVLVAFCSLVATASAQAADSNVQRGEYLVSVLACNDCHTPLMMGKNGPVPDMSRMLSGHPEALKMPPAPQLPPGPWVVTSAITNTAWAGPWGVSFTANLTPDEVTGLGLWSLQSFTNTLRSGKHLGQGRAIMPPMPVAAYKHLTDEDLAAIFSYLKTVPAIRNRVPDPLPPPAMPPH
jgi:mono/diheme cytochrome c family protein